MAYDEKELEQAAIDAIYEHNLIYIEEVCAFLPCSRATFYVLKLGKLDTIKEAINKVKISKKTSLRDKWGTSDNATLNVALYKLLGNDDELSRLNNGDSSKREEQKKIELAPKKEDKQDE